MRKAQHFKNIMVPQSFFLFLSKCLCGLVAEGVAAISHDSRVWNGTWDTGCFPIVLCNLFSGLHSLGDGPRQLLNISRSAARGCTRAQLPGTRAEPPRALRGTR